MKAAVIKKFGSSDVLEIDNNYPEPIIKDNQVLINVKATGINPLDWKIRKGMLRLILGSNFPIILGNDAAGIIVKCGKKVKDFKVGDNVYCMLDSNEGFSYFGFAKSGSYAEYAVTREDTLSLKPETLSYEEAASFPLCCLTVYQVLIHKVNIKKGDRILINGASGGVGIFAIQIAKALGAIVTAVCSTKNIELIRRIGADYVVDYTKNDFLQLNEKFDIVYDVVVGTTYKKCKNILNNNGIFISNIANPLVFLFPFLRNIKIFRKRTFAWVEPSGKDLQKITEMVNKGHIKPVIDKVFSIEEIRNAHLYSENGRVVGKLVVKI